MKVYDLKVSDFKTELFSMWIRRRSSIFLIIIDEFSASSHGPNIHCRNFTSYDWDLALQKS